MEVIIMKKNCKKKFIPTLKFNSDYFHCPVCGWEYPGPLRILGDSAPTTKCERCGHVGLVRNK